MAGSCDSTKTVPHRNYRGILKEDVETALSFIHNYVNQSILSEVDSVSSILVSRLIKIETAKSLCRGRDVWGLDSPLIVDTRDQAGRQRKIFLFSLSLSRVSRDGGDADLGKAVFSAVCRAGLRGSRGRAKWIRQTAATEQTGGGRERGRGTGERRGTQPPALEASTRGPKIAHARQTILLL